MPKICRTIFGENIRCITFRYFCTKIFFELVNIFGTGCGTICCVVVWCHYCVAGPGLIWLVSRKFYLVTWRHCGQESAVQCGPQYKIFYFLISVPGPGSQIALLSLSLEVLFDWVCLQLRGSGEAARLRWTPELWQVRTWASYSYAELLYYQLNKLSLNYIIHKLVFLLAFKRSYLFYNFALFGNLISSQLTLNVFKQINSITIYDS